MPKAQLRFSQGFKVALSNKRAQVATMVLRAGDSEGGPDNKHKGADQWMYVQSGVGTVTIGGRKHDVRAGTLVLIERGSTHEVRNTGRGLLKTLNVYVPPAYTAGGDELPRGRRS